MSKKYELRKVKSKRSYTFKEIAEIYEIHIRTVQSWHSEGLQPLDGSRNPYLIMGSEVKRFLKQKTQSRKTKLKDNEFFCMKCRIGVMPLDVHIEAKGIKLGGNKTSVRLVGKCPKCSSTVNRFGSKLTYKNEEKSNTVWALENPRKD
jgi:hypothetical protein